MTSLKTDEWLCDTLVIVRKTDDLARVLRRKRANFAVEYALGTPSPVNGKTSDTNTSPSNTGTVTGISLSVLVYHSCEDAPRVSREKEQGHAFHRVVCWEENIVLSGSVVFLYHARNCCLHRWNAIN